jgi:hypothetical protein
VVREARRAALGSIARDRSGGVDRFYQGAARVGLGPGFLEAVSDCAARPLERVVEFVAGIALGDSRITAARSIARWSNWRVMIAPQTLSLASGVDDDVPSR